MLTLAAAPPREAVTWFVLAASCFATAWLIRSPPPRRVDERVPYRISWLAIILATLWLATIVSLPWYLALQGDEPTHAVAEELNLTAIGLAGLEGILVTAILYLALEIPRL